MNQRLGSVLTTRLMVHLFLSSTVCLMSLEERLARTSPCIPFKQICELPNRRQYSALYGNVVNVSADVSCTENILPRSFK